MNKIDLNGRCAVVTGGAQGFGRAITERFVASGAKVAIWDHDQPLAEKTAKEIGAASRAIQVDVSDLAAVEKARDETLKAFGKIDIFVNNAGIAGINKTVWETDFEEWRKVLRINLDGPFVCCKAIAPSDDQAKLRAHHQHRLHRRQGRQSQRRALLGLESRPDRADEVARQGACPIQHHGQCGDAGRGQDRDLRPDDPSTTSTSCCRRFRKTASSWSKNWPRSQPGSPRKTARSPPARCSIFPEAGRRIEKSSP